MDILGEACSAWVNTVRGHNNPTIKMTSKALTMMKEAAPDWEGKKYKSAVIEIDEECAGIELNNEEDSLKAVVNI